MIKKIHAEQDATMVYATHDLNEAFKLADRILILEQGQVVAIGTPEELRSMDIAFLKE